MLRNAVYQVSRDFLNEAMGSPRLLEDMAAMEKYMAESYGERVFVELLQNADDANSRKILVCNYGGHLIFANDGRPFDEKDVIAISRAGASTKDRGSSIGYRGIGFKSTTYLTSEIIIFSDNVYFTFSKSICSKTLKISESKIPIVRIPFLIDNIDPALNEFVEGLTRDGFTTIFIFQNARFQEFIEEVKEINNGYFLFLRNITFCQINVLEHKSSFTLSRSDITDGQVVTFAGIKNEQWLIVGDTATKLAFKYDCGKIIPCDEEEAVYHCYLPTLDKVCFPLKINSNFSTDPSRKHLTLDDNSKESLKHSAQVLFRLVIVVLNEANRSSYSNLLAILSIKFSFSKANSLLNDNLKHSLIKSSWMRINSGTINPVDYKMLPDWLEESEKTFIRANSKYIQSHSLPERIYKNISQVDSFLSQISSSRFSTPDFIRVMEEADFIIVVGAQTQGKLFANIIQSVKSDWYISGTNFQLENILLRCVDGVHTLSEIEKDQSIRLDTSVIEAITQYASAGDILWFSNKIAIQKERLLKELSQKSPISANEINKVVVNKPLISKWRSAEQQCVEIEKHLGNDAIDVSLQNFGYDVESTSQNGVKRYIEVKSLASIGSSFSITNNEYTAAHQQGDNYYLCLIVQTKYQLTAIYIQNPVANLQLQKRVKQWEWYCEDYKGEEVSFDYLSL